MPEPKPSPAQHRALGHIDAQDPYEGMPPGRLRLDRYGPVSGGLSKATWQAVQRHGWVEVEPHADFDYLKLTPLGAKVLGAANTLIREDAARAVSEDPNALTDEEWALLRRAVLKEHQPGHFSRGEMMHADYLARIALEAKMFIEAAPGGGARISRAGAAALNHRHGTEQRDPDPVPRPDRDNELPYRLRQIIIDAIDIHVGQLPHYTERHEVNELEELGLARRLKPTYVWALTAAAYVAVGRAWDTQRMLEMAVRQYQKEGPAMSPERRQAWLAASCPTGLSVQSFSEAVDALVALHDDKVALGQKYAEEHQALALREHELLTGAFLQAHPELSSDDDEDEDEDTCPSS